MISWNWSFTLHSIISSLQNSWQRKHIAEHLFENSNLSEILFLTNIQCFYVVFFQISFIRYQQGSIGSADNINKLFWKYCCTFKQIHFVINYSQNRSNIRKFVCNFVAKKLNLETGTCRTMYLIFQRDCTHGIL